LSDISGCNEIKMTQLRSDIYSELVDLLQEMKLIKEINKNCVGKRICIYPDADDEDDLPTFARIVRDNKDIIILSLSEIDNSCYSKEYIDYVEREIELYLGEQKKGANLENEKLRYNMMFNQIKTEIKININID